MKFIKLICTSYLKFFLPFGNLLIFVSTSCDSDLPKSRIDSRIKRFQSTTVSDFKVGLNLGPYSKTSDCELKKEQKKKNLGLEKNKDSTTSLFDQEVLNNILNSENEDRSNLDVSLGMPRGIYFLKVDTDIKTDPTEAGRTKQDRFSIFDSTEKKFKHSNESGFCKSGLAEKGYNKRFTHPESLREVTSFENTNMSSNDKRNQKQTGKDLIKNNKLLSSMKPSNYPNDTSSTSNIISIKSVSKEKAGVALISGNEKIFFRVNRINKKGLRDEPVDRLGRQEQKELYNRMSQSLNNERPLPLLSEEFYFKTNNKKIYDNVSYQKDGIDLSNLCKDCRGELEKKYKRASVVFSLNFNKVTPSKAYLDYNKSSTIKRENEESQLMYWLQENIIKATVVFSDEPEYHFNVLNTKELEETKFKTTNVNAIFLNNFKNKKGENRLLEFNFEPNYFVFRLSNVSRYLFIIYQVNFSDLKLEGFNSKQIYLSPRKIYFKFKIYLKENRDFNLSEDNFVKQEIKEEGCFSDFIENENQGYFTAFLSNSL